MENNKKELNRDFDKHLKAADYYGKKNDTDRIKYHQNIMRKIILKQDGINTRDRRR